VPHEVEEKLQFKPMSALVGEPPTDELPVPPEFEIPCKILYFLEVKPWLGPTVIV